MYLTLKQQWSSVETAKCSRSVTTNFGSFTFDFYHFWLEHEASVATLALRYHFVLRVTDFSVSVYFFIEAFAQNYDPIMINSRLMIIFLIFF